MRFNEYVKPFKPDLVILGFFECDIRRNMFTFRDYEKPVFKYIDLNLLEFWFSDLEDMLDKYVTIHSNSLSWRFFYPCLNKFSYFV